MIYSSANGNNRILLPQDFRQDCPNENYPFWAITNHYGTGLLTLNLTIDKNVRTRLASFEGERFEAPTQIVISPNCTLTINGGKIYEVKYDSYIQYEQDYYTKFYLKPFSVVELKPNNSQLIFENTNHLILECDSKIIIGSGSKLEMQAGSKLCMRGGTVSGSGQFIVLGQIPRFLCLVPCVQDNIFEDSVKFIVASGAGFVIPDSTTYIFRGVETALICKDNSTIKFGKGSKLVFQDGARINANGCNFLSYDSTETWDGIYLSGLSYDTLKNCTFQNAVNGVNITDKVSTGINNLPATQITDCIFKNSTSSNLLNYIYINNSANVLIRNSNSVKTSSGGFSAGYIIEYCPTGGVILVDNNINYAETGITVIQSSPYIARNTISGPTNSGIGISLDNSNGTIEYNTVNNFNTSASLYYSSPFMLKNTFSGAKTRNIELTAYSVPVMRTVVSGSTLLWLGGNNNITGSPSEAGITFSNYAQPLMDSGYNITNVNGSNYMSGFTIASILKVSMNNWYDDPPQPSLFNIRGEPFEYEPVFDGTVLPSTDYHNLNSLGFGLYDTVYVKDLGDSPNAESLFMQAYTNEMNGNYAIAVIKYKNVISEYKSSSYAPVSLSRIFNCLEKANSPVSAYQIAQSYYNNIKSDTTYPTGIREISEDYSIKTKVKQGMLEDAITDYDNIYQHNPNSPKGRHALLNKLCLINMLEGGDNPNGGSPNSNHKVNLLALILGKDINNNQTNTNNTLPFAYKLHQNFPNPFNPVTTIKYDIPNDNLVTVKVYDILGRQIFTSSEYKTAGSYEVKFDGTNLASGLYFYSLEAGSFKETKKMLLIK